MAVVYKLLEDKAFICGDTETLRTCYSYPTSPNASRAHRKTTPVNRLAEEIMRAENSLGAWRDGYTDFDATNWERMGFNARDITAKGFCKSWV
jgi:hypothetical protein